MILFRPYTFRSRQAEEEKRKAFVVRLSFVGLADCSVQRGKNASTTKQEEGEVLEEMRAPLFLPSHHPPQSNLSTMASPPFFSFLHLLRRLLA